MTKKISTLFYLSAQDDRTMTSGWSGARYFRSYGRELVSKAGDFVERKVGRAIVERSRRARRKSTSSGKSEPSAQ